MPNAEILKYLKKVLIKGMLHFFWIFPIDNRKVFLLNELSYTYGDNLKYIDLYLDSHANGKYKIRYALKKGDNSIPDNKIVAPNTFLYFKEILTSKIIITNSGGVSYLPKRNKQIIISTWHGGGPYKKTSTDVYNNFWYKKEVKMNCTNIDYIFSSCRYFSEIEAKSMGFGPEKCVNAGLPRNDIFFTEHKEIVKKVRDFYSIPKEKKFILYAPTFRSSNHLSTSKMVSNHIDIDIDLLLSTLKEKYGCDWAFGIRLHPKLADIDMDKMKVINCTSYPDMQELLCCADAIITDYSSLMWDYSFTYRPIFLYAPDIEKYERERGFYMPASEWPYPIAHNNDEMKENILAFDSEKYIRQVKEHHIAAGSYEMGNACKKIFELIEKSSRLF